MTDRNIDRKYASFICGKCKHEIFYPKSEEVPLCDECGAVMEGTTSATSNTTTGKAIAGGDESYVKEYIHRTRDNHDVPAEVKISLSNPNG